jgi:hypothetical protein
MTEDHVERILKDELSRATLELEHYADSIQRAEEHLASLRKGHNHQAEKIHAIHAALGHKKAFA